MKRLLPLLVATALFTASCSSETTDSASETSNVEEALEAEQLSDVDDADEATTADDSTATETSSAESSTFLIEVWADNWSAVYVDGELVGEDSVPITTERSFNAEMYEFEASAPFTVAIEARDFKETDSGIEYIGERNQQMGDGGIIAQITDVDSGEIVALTDDQWSSLVVHQAPLNTECASDPDPDATCEFAIVETPTDWMSTDFDDSDWVSASVWSAADVDPKDGYDEITWDPSAELIWGTDLEIDNTILLRREVS